MRSFLPRLQFGVGFAAASVAGLATVVGCHGTPREQVRDADAGGARTAVDASSATSFENGSALPSASVEAAVNPAKLPAYKGPTGSLEGTVLVKGPEAPDLFGIDVKACPAALDTYGKLFRAGPARADGLRPLADAVVEVTGYDGFFVPEANEAERVAISANCAYPQRTIAMTLGQRLEIVNDSMIAFAPLLSGRSRAAVMIAPPERHGDAIRLYPPRAGHFMLFDHLQPFVREVVLVLLQPLHAVSNLAGHFRIDGIPTGKLKVGAQLDSVGANTDDVYIRAGVVENVDIVLTYAPPPPSDAGKMSMPRPRVIP